MNEIIEIRNENYIGYIFKDEKIISDSAFHVLNKGNINGLAKCYKLK